MGSTCENAKRITNSRNYVQDRARITEKYSLHRFLQLRGLRTPPASAHWLSGYTIVLAYALVADAKLYRLGITFQSHNSNFHECARIGSSLPRTPTLGPLKLILPSNGLEETNKRLAIRCVFVVDITLTPCGPRIRKRLRFLVALVE